MLNVKHMHSYTPLCLRKVVWVIPWVLYTLHWVKSGQVVLNSTSSIGRVCKGPGRLWILSFMKGDPMALGKIIIFPPHWKCFFKSWFCHFVCSQVYAKCLWLHFVAVFKCIIHVECINLCSGWSVHLAFTGTWSLLVVPGLWLIFKHLHT